MGDLFTGPHIIVILIVVLIMFGGKKIPELMRGLGRGIREFKDARDNVSKEINDHMNEENRVNSNSSNPNSTTNKQVSSGSSVNN
jgi:sec-independent protein translocase protein TatA